MEVRCGFPSKWRESTGALRQELIHLTQPSQLQ